MLVNKDFRQIGLGNFLSIVMFVLMRCFVNIYFWIKANYLISEWKVLIKVLSIF